MQDTHLKKVCMKTMITQIINKVMFISFIIVWEIVNYNAVKLRRIIMKTLLIDLENGYKSIGGKDTIEEKFGLPLLNFNDFTSFRNYFSKL